MTLTRSSDISENPQTSPHGRNGGNSNEDIMKRMVTDSVRLHARKLKSTLIGEIESKLSEMVDGVLCSLEDEELQPNNNRSALLTKYSTIRDKSKSDNSRTLPEKEFMTRQSPLTELLEVPHFKTIHHIFIATLALFIINIIITELIETGSVDLGIEGFLFAFGKPHLMFGILAGMHAASLFLVHPVFSLWSKYRLTLKEGSIWILDYFALVSFLGFMVGFICVPGLIMVKNPLPPASGATVTMEMCRLLMKMYAFVRSNAPRALASRKSFRIIKGQSKTDGSKISTSESSSLRNRTKKQTVDEKEVQVDGSGLEDLCPEYSKYLYFLFAPTLIYRDSYPRTRIIRWNYVSWNFVQTVACSWYINFIIGRCCSTYFVNFGHPDHSITITQLIQTIFSLMLPAIIILVLAFFLLLHAWQNAFAEMLCFGDRLFYKDWWNCSSFSSYYRTWNIIVHDWLYTYVYKDAWECGLGRKHPAIPTMLVFLISSLFHEFIISFTFNFFFPVLLTLFGGFGFAFVFIRSGDNAVGNVLMWMGLIAGTGIIVALYGFEYFARMNCPLSDDDISAWDFFKPRALSLACGAITMTF